MMDIEKEIKKLESERVKLSKQIQPIEDKISEINEKIDELMRTNDYFDDFEVCEAVKDKVFLFHGGLKSTTPVKYMKDVIKAFCKKHNYDQYNTFVEDHLDNPYYPVLIVDYNSFKFKKIKLKKKE